MFVVFVAGLVLGGVIAITVISIMHMAKYAEISDSEWDMWREHLNKNGKKNEKGEELHVNNRSADK